MPLLRPFSDRRPKGSFPSVSDRPVMPGMDPDITRSTPRRRRNSTPRRNRTEGGTLGTKLAATMKNRLSRRKSPDPPMLVIKERSSSERRRWKLDWARRRGGSDSGSSSQDSDELPLMNSGSMDSSLNFGSLGSLV